jgi:phosphate-selective porin
LACFILLVLGPVSASAADEAPLPAPAIFSYSAKGTDIRSPDGNYTAHINLRLQLRYTSTEEEGGESSSEFEFKRVRFKMGGQLAREELTYYTEYDFPSQRLLDLRFTFAADEAVQFRVGQWKIPYNRERVDSSGNQQFTERSIVTNTFTLDRQRGIALYGRLWAGQAADSWYNLAVCGGNGRGSSGMGARPLLLGRWQWNFLQRDLDFSQSDTGYREKPAASLAVATASWRGPYTAYSAAGGGELPGFAVGDDDRYDVSQVLLEAAYQYRGFSFQAEWHWKTVRDTAAHTATDLAGGYVQAGFFPHALWSGVPKPLELAARWAEVDPNTIRGGDRQREPTLCANWFFAGHRNKLTVDYSWLTDEAVAPAGREQHRVRLQWDLSI